MMKAAKTTQPATENALIPWTSSPLMPRPFHLSRDHQGEEKRENRTGLPDRLKAGIEHLSGVSLDDVRVHYNSDKPASVGASAYAQGTQIHVGPGQEHTLPHEAWHVVQQKQGRVKVTRKTNNKGVNDESDLETEASAMGYLAGGNETRVHLGNTSKQAEKVSNPQRPTSLINGSQVIQLTEGDEKLPEWLKDRVPKNAKGRVDHETPLIFQQTEEGRVIKPILKTNEPEKDPSPRIGGVKGVAKTFGKEVLKGTIRGAAVGAVTGGSVGAVAGLGVGALPAAAAGALAGSVLGAGKGAFKGLGKAKDSYGKGYEKVKEMNKYARSEFGRDRESHIDNAIGTLTNKLINLEKRVDRLDRR